MTAIRTYIADSAAAIQRRNRRDSDPQIDLLRLFGMFCIVYAHCTSQGLRLFGLLPASSVYVIGLFVFCVGYFYRKDNDHADPRTYLLGRARAYLLPYFLWNLFYGVITAVLRALGVIQYGEPLTLYTLFVSPWLDPSQFQLNYAAWFLPALFLVVVCTWVLRRLLSHSRASEKTTDLILLGLMTLAAAAAVCLLGQGKFHYGPMIAVLRPVTILPFYQLGYVYKTYWADRLHRWYWGAALLLIQAALSLLNRVPFETKMVYGYFVGNPLLLVLTAVCMTLLLSWAAFYLGTLIHGRLLKFASHCTMYIMLHHLFVLFAMHLVLWGINHIYPLAGFSAAQFHASMWYIYLPLGRPMVLLYAAVCYAVPVAVHFLYERAVCALAKRMAPAKVG